MNGSRKFLFIINARSGPGNVSWEEIINKYFKGKPGIAVCINLEKSTTIDTLKQQILQEKPHAVIAVGGDGTVSLVAQSVTGTKIPLGILPAGSANGMAKELNIPADAGAALEIIENGIAGACDAILINQKLVCLHLADIGINAQFIKYFSEGKLRGWLGYAKVFLKTIWRSQKINITIDTEEKKISTKAYMVVLANASKYGTGAVINPEGRTDDGKFEVVLVYSLSFVEVLKTLFKPKSIDPKKIESFHSRKISIRSRKKVHFQVDGEYIGKTDILNAAVLADYIQVIRPVQD
ncbi:MAG: diacylglycerol kinase family lipid kinase [Bacteroidetes bacterium]|nr:diacylglycerol kinase family lipid kinase [Bacteroidota bacterium]